MPDRDVELLALLLSQGLLAAIGFGPSKQLCEEFAIRVYEEAESVGHQIDLG